MTITPKFARPLLHRIIDLILALRGLHLPSYNNLTAKFRYLRKGVDEQDIQFVAQKFIQPGACVIDVGANAGLTAKAFAKAVGKTGRVVAIEPERSNFSYLCANNLKYPWVEPHRLAFSANSETRDLRLNPVSGTGNSFFGDSSHPVQKVRCLTFDKFCKQEEIFQIDWIKIDVEGAELEVLGGIEETLERNPNVQILIELCPMNLERAGSSTDALMMRLRELGFKIDVLNETKNGFVIEECADPSEFLESKFYINLICTRK